MASRAERRRIQRREQKQMKQAKKMGRDKPSEIHLFNPVADFYETFIYANSTKCDRVAEPGKKMGQSVAICGAGPSLREHVDVLDTVADVWGVNSAAVWLHEHGHKLTHAFTIDQTPTMLKEWVDPPPVEYLLASTVHPHLTDYLMDKDLPITWFHNYVGIRKPDVEWLDEKGESRRMAYEDWLYTLLFPLTVRVGEGLNGVPRAFKLAQWMGYERIVLLGADCAMHATSTVPDGLEPGTRAYLNWLEENTDFHVDGGSAITNNQSPMILQGEIDGRMWTTKADLMVTAVTIARWLRDGEPGLEVVGDVLPVALKDKDEEFFARLPGLKDGSGESVTV